MFDGGPFAHASCGESLSDASYTRARTRARILYTYIYTFFFYLRDAYAFRTRFIPVNARPCGKSDLEI